MNLRKRLYRQTDPLSDLHAPRAKRKNTDEGRASNAGGDSGFDRDKVRANMTVTPEDDLQ